MDGGEAGSPQKRKNPRNDRKLSSKSKLPFRTGELPDARRRRLQRIREANK